MSEVRILVDEFVDELRDRFAAWRLRSRSRRSFVGYDPADTSTDVSEIEFTPLDPFPASKKRAPRGFAEMTPAWIATQCAPHVFAQGQQLVFRKQVTRTHAHAGRLTGTTQERHYDDQEILLEEGRITATCTCQQRALSASAQRTESASRPANTNHHGFAPEPTRTLPCAHVVAVLLAYLQAAASTPANGTQTRSASLTSGKQVCPITRQPLNPNKPLLQCAHCGLYYSPEGWEFLRKEARGCCCNCQARNKVKEVTGP